MLALQCYRDGEVGTVLVPCGHTLAHVCPSCTERAGTLRAAQCREGWHLEDEPDIPPTRTRNAIQRSLRCLGERGLALLTGRWRTLRHITASPGKIGDIARAALFLNHFEHGTVGDGKGPRLSAVRWRRRQVSARRSL